MMFKKIKSRYIGWPEFRRQNFESLKYWIDFSVTDLPDF